MLHVIGFKLIGIFGAKFLTSIFLKSGMAFMGTADQDRLMEKENFVAIKESCLGFLRAHKLAVVSTISEGGIPTAATVMFFIDESWNIYFITRQNTRKFKNLMKNENVAMVVGTELAPGTVQINGVAKWLEGEGLDFVEKITLDQDLKNLYYGPFLNLEGKDFAVFKVEVSWLRYLYLNLKTQKEDYYQIIG